MYDAIERLAKKRNKNIAWVAREAGISDSAMSMMKTRGTKPSLDNAIKIAKVFDMTVEDLLREAEVPDGTP